MASNHLIKFRHHFIVRNQFTAIGRVDADLDERLIFGFGLGGALDCMRCKPASAAALRLGDAIDEGEGLRVESGGDYG